MKKSRVIQIIREEIEKVVNEDKVQSTFNSIKDEGLLDDRGEYDVEDLESAYQLSSEDAQKLFTLIQNSTGRDDLKEENLNEMATFYKIKGDKKKAKSALNKAKEKYREGSSLYNTLDTLAKKGQIDYKELAKDTGKDVATWNNPKSRGVLEKELADYLEWEAGKRGRKADPNKPKKAKAKKTKAKAKASKEKPSKEDEAATAAEKAKKKADNAKKRNQKRELSKLENPKEIKEKIAVALEKYKEAKKEGDKNKMSKFTKELKDLQDERKKITAKMEKDQDDVADAGKGEI